MEPVGPSPARLAPALLLLLGACGGTADPEGASVAAPAPGSGLDAPASEEDAPRVAGSAGADREVPADAPLVVFLGDSIVAGLHLAADEAWPAVLAERLADAGTPIRVVNAGVSGDTSAGALTRVDWVLRGEPDVLVVAIGGNDGLRGIGTESTRANVRAIAERGRVSGAHVLLLGVRLPPNLGPDYVREFEAIYPEVADELELAFLPFYMEGVGGVPELNLSDWLHPTPEGHARLAENVEPALAAVLEELAGDAD